MAKKKAQGSRLLWAMLWPIRVVTVIVLPFFVLIRFSVTLYEYLKVPAWVSLAVGTLITMVLLYFYLNYLSRLITGKKKTKDKAKRFNFRVALIVMAGFTAFSMLYISAKNTKTSTIQAEYAAMHPLLRTAVSVLLLFDRDAVVTDMSRTHSDYALMNLVQKKRSLHYIQSDGYVHALDFRTKGRSESRNKWLDLYFRAMGFRTLRHTGTEDHLHVSLMIHDNPRAL